MSRQCCVIIGDRCRRLATKCFTILTAVVCSVWNVTVCKWHLVKNKDGHMCVLNRCARTKNVQMEMWREALLNTFFLWQMSVFVFFHKRYTAYLEFHSFIVSYEGCSDVIWRLESKVVDLTEARADDWFQWVQVAKGRQTLQLWRAVCGWHLYSHCFKKRTLYWTGWTRNAARKYLQRYRIGSH